MKWLVLVLIVCVGCGAYHLHEKSVAAAQAVAREQALEESRREAESRLTAERERAAARRPLMGISKVLEPLLVNVQAPLNLQEPADLVPTIEITKQRILDKRVHAELERQPVYDRATAVMDHLAVLAEERTQLLVSMLRTRASASTILNRPTGSTTSDFFNLNTVKRWEETVARARPATLQLMEQLRTAERDWNKRLERTAETEMYDVFDFKPLLIPTEQTGQNSLSSDAKASNTATRVWRRTYYTAYGYR
jgi:hypothetical protein